MKNIETNNSIWEVINTLYQTLEQRKKDFELWKISKEESYTVKLLDKWVDAILKKVSEETAELLLWVKNNDKENIVYELADILYFLNVLMVYSWIKPCQIVNELARRFWISGIEEKQNRIKK